MAIKNMEFVEIRTRHMDQATNFYKNTLDWHLSPTPEIEGADMAMSTIDTGMFPSGGLAESTSPEVPLGVIPYLTVENCTETALLAQKQGATLIIERQPVGDMGWFSIVVDPWGSQVGFWEDKERMDPASFEFKGPGNNFCWLEFNAPNLDQAVAFYKTVMGWDFYSMPEIPDYAFVKDLPMDDPAGVMGIGIASGDAAKAFPGSTVYVEVPNLAQTEDKVRENGGKVLLSKREIPSTGFFSITEDPEGNRLALIEMTKAS